VNVDGTTYSYGPAGMSILPTSLYLDKNDFRDGIGTVVPLTPDQEKALVACLKGWKGKYSSVSNSCVDPPARCLEKLGLKIGSILFPVSLGNRLLDILVDPTINFYPPTQPAQGSSAPWAR